MRRVNYSQSEYVTMDGWHCFPLCAFICGCVCMCSCVRSFVRSFVHSYVCVCVCATPFWLKENCVVYELFICVSESVVFIFVCACHFASLLIAISSFRSGSSRRNTFSIKNSRLTKHFSKFCTARNVLIVSAWADPMHAHNYRRFTFGILIMEMRLFYI